MESPRLGSIRTLLAGLRRRVRRTWALRGAAITLTAVLAALLVSFGLDWFLDLPLAVRAVHLALVAVGVLLVVRWALVKPLRVPMSEEDLAQAVEHGVPDLHDRLVSALDFERRLSNPDEPESRELMSEVVRDAATMASHLDAGLLVDERPARRAAAVAAAVLAVCIAVVASMPAEFGLWVRRGILLSDLDWPRVTHIRVLGFPADGTRVVTRGDDLRITALVEGDEPRELVLHYEELATPVDGQPEDDAEENVTFTDTRRMYPVEQESGAVYAIDFRSVATSFRFWVTGGDDQDDRPVYSVRALVPPRIAKIEGEVIHPDYAGLPEAKVTAPQFEVLEGSRVELKLTTNMPLRSAQFVPANGPAQEIALAAAADRIELRFEVKETLEFHLELLGRDGQRNRAEDDAWRIVAVQDRPPVVRVLFPPARLYRTPNGIVPVKLLVSDDFAIASVGVSAAKGTAPQDTERLASYDLWPPRAGGTAPKEPQRRLDLYHPVDLQQFQGDAGPQVKAGDVVHLTVNARDSHQNEASVPELTVEVLSPDDFQRRLFQRQAALREELTVLRRNQQRAHFAIADMSRVLEGTTPAPRELERGRDLQVDQGRVTNDLAQFLGGIRQVFDSYVLDRVGDGPAIERLLPLYHEALAAPAEADEQVFPDSLYDKILTERRENRLFDPQVLGTLLEILDLGDRAVRELSPAVYRELDSWTGGVSHDHAHLVEADRLAAELGARLAELDLRMQRWEELGALIEIAQTIRDIEDGLSEDPAVPGEK